MSRAAPRASLRAAALVLLAVCGSTLPTTPLPLHHRLLAEVPGGGPEQVHLSVGNTRDQVVVSWAEQRTEAPSEVTVQYGLAPDALGTTVYASPGAVSTYSSLDFYDVDQLKRPDMDNAVFNISVAQLVAALTTPDYLGGGPPPKPESLRPTFGNAANPVSSSGIHRGGPFPLCAHSPQCHASPHPHRITSTAPRSS